MTNFTQTIKNFSGVTSIRGNWSLITEVPLDYHLFEAQYETLTRDFHPNRKREWIFSRIALSQSLKALKQNNQSLSINSHHHLEQNPDLLVSLTHTQNCGASFLVEKNQDVLSVGIDIEGSSRVMKESSSKYFLNSNDQISQSDKPLWLWSAKEAIFKALSYYFQEKTFVLKHIWVNSKSQTFGHVNYSEALGHFSHQIENNFLISFAIVTKSPKIKI